LAALGAAFFATAFLAGAFFGLAGVAFFGFALAAGFALAGDFLAAFGDVFLVLAINGLRLVKDPQNYALGHENKKY
jgi:hypothetical protein